MVPNHRIVWATLGPPSRKSLPVAGVAAQQPRPELSREMVVQRPENLESQKHSMLFPHLRVGRASSPLRSYHHPHLHRLLHEHPTATVALAARRPTHPRRHRDPSRGWQHGRLHSLTVPPVRPRLGRQITTDPAGICANEGRARARRRPGARPGGGGRVRGRPRSAVCGNATALGMSFAKGVLAVSRLRAAPLGEAWLACCRTGRGQDAEQACGSCATG